MQTKSPVVEQEGAYDALCDVVRKTHFAIRGNLHQPVVQACPVEGKNHACYQYQHEREFGQGSDDEPQWGQYGLVCDEVWQHVA